MCNPLAIEKPTLVLHAERARRNIETMASKAFKSSVRFRPHFKTHQSAQIGEWFRECGVESITVSSLDMADYFAGHGWRDITVAFPANILEIAKINGLAEAVDLGLLVESTETAVFLARHLTSRAGVWIKIDVGSQRTGIAWDRLDRVLAVAEQVERARLLSFRGLLTHAGHAYQARSREEIKKVHGETVARMAHVRAGLSAEGLPGAEVSVGDTPTCTVMDDFGDVDEIRPGNFVFYDVMQLELRVCSEEEIAVAVACPVVAKHEDRSEAVVYGGAIHLSTESIAGPDGAQAFGYVALPTQDGWGPAVQGGYVSSLSQEHGVVKLPDHVLGGLRVGDVLMVVPVHSCLTANLMKTYRTLDGQSITAMGVR
ncbi:MAG TPA: alanine racemase [Anaerolineae bacterium]|nr:alanine racemase [Anaerolineae bacterium]